MGHGVAGRETAITRLDPEQASQIAATLQALATPSRLHILVRLRQGPCPVGELAESIDMEPSAVSHQLRLLRTLGLVNGERAGRSIIYSLHDNHVAQLLDQALYHVEHLRLGVRDPINYPSATG
jgi:DNA-binding transcriptional ArsR family regulator